MTPQLLAKINELIEIDKKYQDDQRKKHPNGIELDFNNRNSIDAALSGAPSPVLIAVEKLSNDELAYVMAIMWWGRGDGDAEPGAKFNDVLDHAMNSIDAGSALYIAGKPLSVYLTRGLGRPGIT